jgi:hypothetical protein
MPARICFLILTLTDVELECDGLFAYDRTPHFNDEDVKQIYDANRKLTLEP